MADATCDCNPFRDAPDSVPTVRARCEQRCYYSIDGTCQRCLLPTPTVRESCRYGFLSADGYPEEGPNPLLTPTVREAGDEGIAAVLAAHVWWPGTPRDGNPGCYCGWRCPIDKGTSRHDQHAAHVATTLAPLIAEREAKAWDEGLAASYIHPEPPNPYRAALAPETPEADK